MDENRDLPKNLGLSAPASVQTTVFFYNLDALRGICAILVALFHAAWGSHFRYFPIIGNGWIFVDFFFILSGFVISHNYALRLKTRTDLSRFAIRRFFRLYPLHIFAFLLYMVLTIGGSWLRLKLNSVPPPDNPPLRDVVQAIFLVQSLGFSASSYNGPSWSISAELWAYLIFGVLAMIFSKYKLNIFYMSSISLISGAALYKWNFPLGTFTTHEFGFIRCLCGFFIGTAVWGIWTKTVIRPRQLAFNIMHGIALSSMLLAFVYIDFNSSENMLMLPIFAVIIFLCAIDHGSAFKTFLETYPLRHLGKISYSLYMMHMSVQIGCLFIVSNIAPDLKYGLATQFGWSRLLIGDAITIVYVLLIVTAATLTYRHIEEPSRRLGSLVADRLTRRKRFAGVGDMILPVSAQKNLD